MNNKKILFNNLINLINKNDKLEYHIFIAYIGIVIKFLNTFLNSICH